ncbi:hypothetical protein [Thermoactinospora rubra]|uniref:hypothetical protein n=1 Tax=Thermoactinospora rubra TaxID=1088767 RepID=UPI000A111CA9|nr:hypothetical protein [Thermoactinospora rubra]
MAKFLPPEIVYVMVVLKDRLQRARQASDRGSMSAEAMIIIAALVLVALAVMGIVTAKIISKANSIDLG